MLEAARELHKYFYDAKEVLAMIQEKENLLTDDLGRDLNSLHQLQVVHQGFEADLAPLGNQVGRVHKIFPPFCSQPPKCATFPAFFTPWGSGRDRASKHYNIFSPLWREISRLHTQYPHFFRTTLFCLFFDKQVYALEQYFCSIERSFAVLNYLSFLTRSSLSKRRQIVSRVPTPVTKPGKFKLKKTRWWTRGSGSIGG